MFCSAAGLPRGHWSPRQMMPGSSRMLVIPLGNGERVRPLEAPLQGMRAAVTGAVDFTGCIAAATPAWASLATICGSRTSRPAHGEVRLSRRADCEA